jgi:Family of unknown function (DUF5681)
MTMRKKPRAGGYANPPKRTRFKKGQSGNPKGRPKGSLNFATDLNQELSERITVREDGKASRVSKQKALIKTLVAKALQGDVKALATALALQARLAVEMPQNEDLQISENELLVLKRFSPRLRKPSKKKRSRK